MTIRKLLNTIEKYNPQADLDTIQRAYDFARIAHEGQKRATGDEYIVHCLGTAQNLAELQLSTTLIIAGLLHDVPEDTEYTLEDVEQEFGEEVATIVKGITKLSNIKYRGMERYVENLRKMFVAMAKDIRVILVKFADRLHNLQTLYALPANKQKRIAMESLEIYAPIANRLGIGEMQSKLEDTAFKYAYPEDFEWVEQLVKQRYPVKQKTLAGMIKKLKDSLGQENIELLDIYGRNKHYYSLYRKLLKFNRDINHIYDIVAIRIIVKSVADCYAALGIIHSLWKPVKGRIKDYIAQPKPNGYQSLHTAVFGDNHEIVEFQIRTMMMHEQAEFGIASHWSYKEHGSEKSVKERKKEVVWAQELAKWLKEMKDNEKFLETVKIDVFQNRIFVFTPQGDVIDLPEGATPIDFAFHIHSEIGNKTSRALVNNAQVSLDTKLKNGDMVNIITDKNRKGPNPEWLKFVKTRMARQRIMAYKNKSWKKLFLNSQITKRNKNNSMKKYLLVAILILIILSPQFASAATVEVKISCTCPYGGVIANWNDPPLDSLDLVSSTAQSGCFAKGGETMTCTGTIGTESVSFDGGPEDFNAVITDYKDVLNTEQQKADAAEALLSAASEGLAGSATEGVTSGASEGSDSGASEGATSGASEGQVVDKLPNLLAKNDADTASTNPNVIFGRIIQFIVGIAGSFALLMFVYGGLMWLLSRGQQEYITKGKNAIKFAVLGLVIIATSYIIVKLIITAVGAIS